MTQRQTLTYDGITWSYSFASSAFFSPTTGTTFTAKSGINTSLYGNGNGTLIGGGGGADNIFYLESGDQAVAGAGDGIDTIVAYQGNITLPIGFSDGILSHAGTITGNAGNNILTATGTAAHTLHAGTGNDILIGAAGAVDRFVITQGSGDDVIVGFTPGQDVIELANYTAFSGSLGYASLQTAMTQVGANVVVNLGGTQSLTITNTSAAQLTASSFALPSNVAGWKQTFDDEFNTFSASSNGQLAKWMTVAGTLPANHEAENYVDTAGLGGPFSLSNGVLAITATPTSSAAGLAYTSGEINSKGSLAQTYGFFEMSAELPAGQGMWPAFWLVPSNGSWPPELDVMEQLGSAPSTIFSTTHSAVSGTNGISNTVANTSTGFHTYGVDWEPTTITYYFDGNAIGSVATPADMNQPMYMIINLAVGAAGSWPGAATGETASMLIDWVRAYASPTAVQPPLTFGTWGRSINEGDGSYSVTGNGGGGWITLGNGNQTITLTGAVNTALASNNTIITGNGNQSISLAGNTNVITTGAGTSMIYGGSRAEKITVGATVTGTTVISAGGLQDVITATGDGNVNVSGMQGGATITLMAGNQTVTLAGTGNKVTLGNGNSIVSAGTGQAIVHIGAGNSTITVGGTGNLLDAGAGMNFLNGGTGSDVFMLNAAGQGHDTITGFLATNHDVLDLTRTLAGLALTAGLTNIGSFVSTSIVGSATALMVTPTIGGTAQTIAMLSGINTSLSVLMAHNDIRVGTQLI